MIKSSPLFSIIYASYIKAGVSGIKYLSILAALLICGCSIGQFYTHEDQTASLEKYPQPYIQCFIKLPEETRTLAMRIPMFLSMHSAFIMTGNELSESKILSWIPETNAPGAFSFSTPENEVLSMGCGVPISDDGYFLTAAHVLHEQTPFVLYLIPRADRAHPAVAECRVVMKSDPADVAIIKADLSTPWHLQYSYKQPTKGNILYAGGWMHRHGAGLCNRIKTHSIKINDKQVDAYEIWASIPLLKGDSGSPLIDDSGSLFGVVSGGRPKLLKIIPPESKFTMIDPKVIDQIIEEDRKTNL